MANRGLQRQNWKIGKAHQLALITVHQPPTCKAALDHSIRSKDADEERVLPKGNRLKDLRGSGKGWGEFVFIS